MSNQARRAADALFDIWGNDWEQITEHMASDGFSDLEIAIELERLEERKRSPLAEAIEIARGAPPTEPVKFATRSRS